MSAGSESERSIQLHLDTQFLAVQALHIMKVLFSYIISKDVIVGAFIVYVQK